MYEWRKDGESLGSWPRSHRKSKTALLLYVSQKGGYVQQKPATLLAAQASTNDALVASKIGIQQHDPGTAKVLTGEYHLEARCQEFLRRYPGLRGQYNLELVQCTPYLIGAEKDSVKADLKAVFEALNWTEFSYTSRLDQIVPDSRTPFKDCITFCWYAYCPYSQQGTRMRTLYQNVMFRDSATWYMTNKQAMLRRLLLFDRTRRAAVEAGLCAPGECDITSSSFIPPTIVYSCGREAAVNAYLDLEGTYIVKPAAGLQGRGIELYRRGGWPLLDFGAFMRQTYGEQHILSSFYVVQRYIDRPLLIQGHKFDLRIYLLIVPNMSCSLACDSNSARRGFYAFYHPGFARLSSMEYGDGRSSNRRVHLTNSCVQEAGGTAEGLQLEETNWTPDQVNEYFNKRFDDGLDGIPSRDWFRKVVQADLQGIMAYVVTQFSRLLVKDANNAFKLLGCDFLLDESGRPWLLEMNSMPSMRVRTSCHRAIKAPMQQEALALAIEVAHRSANGLPVNSRCLAMRQNFRLVYSATNPKTQTCLVQAFNQRANGASEAGLRP